MHILNLWYARHLKDIYRRGKKSICLFIGALSKLCIIKTARAIFLLKKEIYHNSKWAENKILPAPFVWENAASFSMVLGGNALDIDIDIGSVNWWRYLVGKNFTGFHTWHAWLHWCNCRDCNSNCTSARTYIHILSFALCVWARNCATMLWWKFLFTICSTAMIVGQLK